MKLTKSTFQIAYLGDFEENSNFRKEERKDWPCMMVPGSQFCMYVGMHSIEHEREAVGTYKYGVAHVPTGRGIKSLLTYTEARRLLERLEAAALPPISLDGEVIMPRDAYIKLMELVNQR